MKYVRPANIPADSAANAEGTVPPNAVINAGLYDEASVMSNVLSNAPLVTPSGKPVNDGVVVATPAVCRNGFGVAAWMWEAVVVPVNPENEALSASV